MLSDLPVLKTVFSIDGRPVKIGKQPALGLSQMQLGGSRLTMGGQKLPEIFHVRTWLVDRWKLLQRNQRCCQCFRENPFVVASNSLFRHLDFHWSRIATKPRQDYMASSVSPLRAAARMIGSDHYFSGLPEPPCPRFDPAWMNHGEKKTFGEMRSSGTWHSALW
jgi:hypothetical protein